MLESGLVTVKGRDGLWQTPKMVPGVRKPTTKYLLSPSILLMAYWYASEQWRNKGKKKQMRGVKLFKVIDFSNIRLTGQSKWRVRREKVLSAKGEARGPCGAQIKSLEQCPVFLLCWVWGSQSRVALQTWAVCKPTVGQEGTLGVSSNEQELNVTSLCIFPLTRETSKITTCPNKFPLYSVPHSSRPTVNR